MGEKTLWSGGRLGSDLDLNMSVLNQSLSIDRRMAREDIQGSIAWAEALGTAGILTNGERSAITNGLKKLLSDVEADRFPFKASDEDIHSAVERQLTEEIGPVAGKLHTGRSRNDQVVTDFRLWLRNHNQKLADCVRELQTALVERAERDLAVVLPGYTHFQQAQPILLSHWWLSHFWALNRDRSRLNESRLRLNQCPLGSGALAGTTVPVDRKALARSLDFKSPTENSLDSVSDRDFATDFLYNCAALSSHLSRMAEALILYSTIEFGYVTLSDRFSTGSSLMPQKKNPDSLELIRGQSGIQLGRLTALFSSLKGLPSAYDKDLQEDKALTFAAFDTALLTVRVMTGVVTTLTVNAERCREAINADAFATDAADYLVAKGVPFREAHHVIGRLVKRAEIARVPLAQLPLADWKAESPLFMEDILAIFTPEASIAMRNAIGGTARTRVQEQIVQAKEALHP